MISRRVLPVPQMKKINFETLKSNLNFKLIHNVPQVIQTESSECGLACAAMICRYYGIDTDLFNLRSRFNISSHGANLGSIMEIFRSLSFKTRPLSLDIGEVSQLKTPCILHWDMNHFVVLVKSSKNKYVIHDPAFGKRVLNERELSNHFTGVALEIWPESKFVETLKPRKLKLTDLLINIKGFFSFLSKIFLLALIIEFLTLLLPVGTQLVMDHVITASDHELLTLICAGLMGLILLRTFCGLLKSWTSLVFNSMVDIQWKIGLFEQLLNLPLVFFEKRKLGDIHSRFTSLNVIRATLSSGIINCIVDSIMCLGLIIGMYLYGGWIVLLVLFFTILFVLLRLSTYQYYKQITEETIVKNARANSHFMETLYGIGTIKSLGILDTRAKQWFNIIVEETNSSIKQSKLDMFFLGANTFIGAIDHIVILWIGASMVMDGNMTLGMFVAFNAYRMQFTERAGNLVQIILSFKILSLHSDRLSDIVLTDPENYQQERKLSPKGQPSSLQLKNIHYRFDSFTKPIFGGLNLFVDPGESLAITGSSGVGKSTLMKIMSGLIKPDEGSVHFDGYDINSVGVNNYRECIACVLQDDRLFAGTIGDNICSFAQVKDMTKITNCAIAACIHEEIVKMPMGYETLVTELGGSLSGGQKQRLLIARALYKEPNILFLDEATSHLDEQNEMKINLSIKNLNITRIFIAHRESTIRSADRIFNLSNN